MKKFTFIFIMLLAMASFSRAQVIEDFESLKMNLMAGGSADSSSFTVVANPDATGANTSATVCKFLRDKDGVPWGGFYAPVSTPVDMTTNKYVHVKVWKPRISPVHLKLEDGAGGASTSEILPINAQSVINGWEELVFDFTTYTGSFNKVTFMPDFEDPLTLTSDITIYYDDFYVNNDATVGSAPLQVIEDFEYITLNYMGGGANDLSTMTILPNPDPSGINVSPYVIKFLRDKDGVPWGGFWSALTTPVDVTTNKYVHVKLWKPRISPVKFKLAGGAAGTDTEIFSLNAQTLTNAWEDFVFDFSALTGNYATISLMPDFEDPLTLTDDITIYFDDIRVNNDSVPMVPPVQVIKVDMKGAGLTAGQPVYISGTLGGIYGSWNTPGDNPNNLMTGPDADSIYSINVLVADGAYEVKFFKGTGWAAGDPVSGNRLLTIHGDLNITYKWGVKAATITLNVDMHGSGLTAGQVVYFAGDFGGLYGSWNAPGTNMNNILTDDNADSVYTAVLQLGQVGTYPFKFFKGSGWDGGEWTGDPNRKIVVTGSRSYSFMWGVKTYNVTFNLDVHGAKLTAGQPVYVSGDFGGDNGSWATPGDNLLNALTPFGLVADSIYSINLLLDTLTYQFKFYKGPGWDNGEWTGDPNRAIKIKGDIDTTFMWGDKPIGIPENPLANKVSAYPVPFNNMLNINTLVDVKTVVIATAYGQQVARFENLAIGRTTIYTSDLRAGMYFVTFYGKNGGQLTQKLIKN